MPTYAAQLGHQPHLSLAELAAVVPGFSLERIHSEIIAIFHSDDELDQEFLETLGGTIILAREISETPLTLDDVPKVLLSETSDVRGKVIFSIRAFGVPGSFINNWYRVTKTKLKGQGKGCRYIGNEKKPALPVLLHDSNIISGKKGCEIVVLLDEGALKSKETPLNKATVWVGKTVGAQDVNSYAWRDMEKPVRDTTVGLLPPKLAQMLVNFGLMLQREKSQKTEPEAATKRKKKEILTVFDPFCGTGVIPLECLLRGWHVVASDNSLKAVNGTQKNIEWLRKEKKILKKDVSSEVFKQDATKPFSLKEIPDVIVTETTLGPAFIKRPAQKEVNKLRVENEKIQAAFLANVAESFPDTPIVCIWPAWKQQGGWVYLEKIWKVLGDLGYQAVLPSGIKPENSSRLTLFYRRPDQFVGREIVLLRRSSTSKVSRK